MRPYHDSAAIAAHRAPFGFTLVELVVTVAIVGILAAIAYPSYVESVRKARRADAQGALQGLAQSMERYFLNGNTYVGAANGSGVPTIFPATVPVDGGTAYYNLRIPTLAANNYVLQAVPVGAQTGDKCGTLILSITGAQTISGAASGVTAAQCWR